MHVKHRYHLRANSTRGLDLSTCSLIPKSKSLAFQPFALLRSLKKFSICSQGTYAEAIIPASVANSILVLYMYIYVIRAWHFELSSHSQQLTH